VSYAGTLQLHSQTLTAVLLAMLLVLTGSARIVSTYTVFNHTIDEPDHLAAGMEYLSTARYLYEDQHPPLARVFGALGPFFSGERFQPGPDSYHEGYRILGWDTHYDRTLALGRAGMLPFFWIASAVVFLWALRAAGPHAALLSTLLFTTLPPVLAHSGLISTDMAAVAFTGAAAFASLLWAEVPDRKRTILFGVCLGLAALSKFSAIPFLAIALPLMHRGKLYNVAHALMRAVSRLISTRRRGTESLSEPGVGMSADAARTSACATSSYRLAAAIAVALVVVWAGYGFSFARVDYLHLRLPAPRFFTGLQTLWAHNAAGHASYLFGARSSTGFWYYYPAALSLKTPLAMLLVLPLCFRRSVAQPMLFSLVVLFCGFASRINIGTRHVLPIYIGLAVACGIAAAPLLRHRMARWIIVGLLLWHVASGALQHPDYLSYTNELAGAHPENFLADSDLDWGQDMKRLAAFLERARATEVTFVPFNRTYGVLTGHAFPEMHPGDPAHPSPGWNAVSVSVWKIFGVPSWPDGHPQAKIGRSIFLWDVKTQGTGFRPRESNASCVPSSPFSAPPPWPARRTRSLSAPPSRWCTSMPKCSARTAASSTVSTRRTFAFSTSARSSPSCNSPPKSSRSTSSFCSTSAAACAAWFRKWPMPLARACTNCNPEIASA